MVTGLFKGKRISIMKRDKTEEKQAIKIVKRKSDLNQISSTSFVSGEYPVKKVKSPVKVRV